MSYVNYSRYTVAGALALCLIFNTSCSKSSSLSMEEELEALASDGKTHALAAGGRFPAPVFDFAETADVSDIDLARELGLPAIVLADFALKAADENGVITIKIEGLEFHNDGDYSYERAHIHGINVSFTLDQIKNIKKLYNTIFNGLGENLKNGQDAVLFFNVREDEHNVVQVELDLERSLNAETIAEIHREFPDFDVRTQIVCEAEEHVYHVTTNLLYKIAPEIWEVMEERGLEGFRKWWGETEENGRTRGRNIRERYLQTLEEKGYQPFITVDSKKRPSPFNIGGLGSGL